MDIDFKVYAVLVGSAKKNAFCHYCVMKTFKKLAVAFVVVAGLGLTFASCAEDAYYEEPVQPLPPEIIEQPLPPVIEPHNN